MKLFNLLGGSGTGGLASMDEIMTTVETWTGNIFLGVMIIGMLFMTVYAIYIAFKLAKAEDDGKRKEAKSHLMWAIIGLASALILVVVIKMIFATPPTAETTGEEAIDSVISIVVSIITCIFNLGGIAAACFAGYIAYKLMTANDDGKRKQAKQQLIWTIIAVLGVFALNGIIGMVFTTLKDAATVFGLSVGMGL